MVFLAEKQYQSVMNFLTNRKTVSKCYALPHKPENRTGISPVLSLWGRSLLRLFNQPVARTVLSLRGRPLLLFLMASLTAVSCIRPPEKRLDPSLRGTIVPVSDLLKLECVLTTGASKKERVNWSGAEELTLERKSPAAGNPYEKLNADETVLYNYKNPTAEGGKKEDGLKPQSTGYINYFPYVSVEGVRPARADKLFVRNGSDNYKTLENSQAVKTDTGLTCSNLLRPEDIPFLTAKPHHNYPVRFQVAGSTARALLLAPAEELPSQSLPYSFKVRDRGEREIYAVPIGGYTVDQGYIEQQENTDWEAVNVLVFRKIPLRRKAEYQMENRGGLVSYLLKYRQKGEASPRAVRQIRFSSRFQPFKTLAERGGKKDVFPKSFLAGDWYHANTVIAQSVSSSVFATAGLQISRDNHYWNSNKIRLRFWNENLVAYTLNRETSKDPLAHSADRWVFKIPVRHLDYRTDSPLGEIDAGLEEIPDNTKSDGDKAYAQIHFNGIRLAGWNPDRKYQLHKVTLSGDYFDFVLQGETAGHQLRFSFLRPPPERERSYIPLILTRAFEKFPVFLHRKRVSYQEKFIRSRAFQSAVHVQRFDPEKPVVYRFSSLTPDTPWIRNLGREIISVWQQVFEKAGVTCGQGPCITLLDGPEHDAELGDIRYNILNLIPPDDFVRFHWLNGYGPSIADFETGEVISATSNLYLDQMHTLILRDIHHYIQSRGGLILPFQDRLSVRLHRPSGAGEDKLFSGTGAGDILVPRFLYSWDPEERGYDFQFGPGETDPVPFFGLALRGANSGRETIELFPENPFSDTSKESGDFSLNGEASAPSRGAALNGPRCSLMSQEGFLPPRLRYRLIDTLCGEKLTLLKEIQNSSITEKSPHIKRHWLWAKAGTEQNRKEIFSCADKVLKVSALGTGLHEMGHNMSLRHNFAASADKDNFLSADGFHYRHTFESDEEKQKVLSLLPAEGVTASVMDYLPSSAERIVPGGYDTAFIRFLYKGEVETVSGSFAKTEITKEGELRYVSEEGGALHPRNLRNYKVCVDGDIQNSADIYCEMFDRGTTPSEIVQNHSDNLTEGLSLDGSGLSPHIFAMGFHLRKFFKKTQKIYHRWRIQLSKALREGDTLTLRNFGARDYRERIASLICEEGPSPSQDEKGGAGVCENGAVKSSELAELYKARTIIYNLLRNMLFSAVRDHYCVLRHRDKNNLEEWVPFSDIQRHLSETSRSDLNILYTEISSCNDVKALFPRTVRKYIGETGIPFLPGVFSLRQNRDFDFYRILDKTRADYPGSAEARALAGVFLFAHTRSPVLGKRPALSLMNEPDIQEDVFQLLTSRILNGIPIGVAEKTNSTVFQPVFSNEEMLWRFLSLPLFFSHGHPTNSLNRIENLTDSLAVVRPMDFSDPNLVHSGKRSLVQKERILKYDRIRRMDGYLIGENKELYPRRSKQSALALINRTKSSHITHLIGALRAIDLRKSFLKFTEKVNQNDRDIFFRDKAEKMQSYLEGLLFSAKRLYSDPSPFVTVLTFSLLYDFLEAGEPDYEYSHLIPPLPNHGALTDALAQQLQLGRIRYFHIEAAFLKKCAETNRDDCPEPYSATGKKKTEGFDELVLEVLKGKTRKLQNFIDTAYFQEQEIQTVNIFKPDLEDLIRSLDTLAMDPAGTDLSSVAGYRQRIFDLIRDLYFMELFRSERHEASEVRQFLTALWQNQKALISEREKAAINQKEKEITESIVALRTLRRHPNSKFFQEIFIRNTLFYSLQETGDSVFVSAFIALLNFVLHPLGLSTLSTAEDVLTFIDIKNGREAAVAQTVLQKTKGGADMYQAVFVDRKTREIIRNFQARAPEILTTSFEEVMSAVRTAPPLPGNPANGLERFFSAAYYDESAPLYEVFNGRAEGELTSQKNIIISAISPYLILNNETEPAEGN